jgi:large subunit ribosomal protein L4
MKLKVYNQTGQEIQEEIELPQEVFGISEVKPDLIHSVAVAMLANRRKAIASTKTRGEVRGGGKKPWQQKGTGRARAGSIRSPLWRGGGVTFGPSSSRNFSKKINKKVRRLSLFNVLTDKVRGGGVMILDKLELPSGKTKDMVTILKNFSAYKTGKKILFILPKADEKLLRAARNLKRIKLSSVKNLNILDLLSANLVVVLQSALPIFKEIYESSKKTRNQKR